MANTSNSSKTPSEFYRERRPEYFSDSEKVYEVKLPKEHFAYELNQISTNQKQDAFETLCRKLAEKFIAPNLIPRVGPTGGGDGKTDSETYPVSEFITDRWFVPENGWKTNENWALAISAKKTWKTKAKQDVKSILETNRGHTKIYFISNQKIRSKNRKEAQDELKKEFGVEVIILDGEWITEKIYDNDLINLAVDSLNLSPAYKNETKLGSNDVARIKRVEELEQNISNPNRYFEYDYQLVEDALESAILTRMIEKPKEEVIGKFDRALRFATKVDNPQQLLRVHYQRARTYINWYDEYAQFVLEFEQVKKYTKQDPNSHSIELYFTLLNLLRGISGDDKIKKEIPNITYEYEEKVYRDILEVCILDTSKPITALIASTYKSFLNIADAVFSSKDVSAEVKILQKHFQDSKAYLEYPFESFKKLIEVFGEMLPDDKDFDNLIDCIAEISGTRYSELALGEMFFERGIQKLANEYYKDSLIFFGKSVKKVAKEESQDYLYSALLGLSQSYRNLGLLWAANNCIVAAASISIKEWCNQGRLSKKLYRCVEEILKNELLLGRVPYILSWYELYKVISRHFEEEPVEEGQIDIPLLVDGCLSSRLLNSPFDTWENCSLLPNLFEKEELWLSSDTVLYMFGQTDLIKGNYLEVLTNSTTIDDYFTQLATQPFKEQIVYSTNLLDAEVIEFRTVILGVDVIVTFKRDKQLAAFAETLLAFFESFLATSFNEAFPSTETISIKVVEGKEIDCYQIIEIHSNNFEVQLNLHSNSDDKITNERIYELLLKLSTQIIGKNFLLKKIEEYLENLFKHEELHERQSFIIEHEKFLMNVLGTDPKIFITDWVKEDAFTKFEFKRGSNPIQINEELAEELVRDKVNEIKIQKHNDTKVFSVIDTALWDKAQWGGVGFLVSPELPLGIFLAYRNGDAGKQIFEDWIKRFGKIDHAEEINLTIIQGVDRDNPFWYRVHISKKLDKDNSSTDKLMLSVSRCHEMQPHDSKNLTVFINGFNHLKQYTLFPASFKSDDTIEPYVELGILKTKLTIRDAWEIGVHDLDSVVIRKEDKPLIPSDKPDAPVIELLKLKKEN